MSVPKWQRTESKAAFIYQTYKLCIRLNEIMANKPKKYKTNNIDRILNAAFDALKNLQIANQIFMCEKTEEHDYLLRRKCLQLAQGDIQHVATTSYILLETIRRHDCENSVKLYKQEMEIGNACENISRLIDGVLKSDKELFRKHIKPQQG